MTRKNTTPFPCAVITISEQSSAPASSSFFVRHWASLLAFCSGFLVLSLEVVLQHQFAQVTINSLFSSGTVLAWGLLSLAAGSALVPWLTKRVADGSSRFRLVLLGAAVLCICEPFLFTWLRNGVDILPYELTAIPYIWEVAKLALVALCPVFVAAGLLFPLLLHEAAAGSSGGNQPASGGFAGMERAWRLARFGNRPASHCAAFRTLAKHRCARAGLRSIGGHRSIASQTDQFARDSRP